MIGTYRIPDNRLDEMKGAVRFSILKMILILFLIFLTAAILRRDADVVTDIVIVTGCFFLLALIALLITAFVHQPVYNTVIQISQDSILRTGDGLLTVRLNYNEIGKVFTKDIGTVLVKKGFLTNLNLYTTEHRPYTTTAGVILIPLSIENYSRIVSFVNDKIKESSASKN